jgi:hypothetical protein
VALKIRQISKRREGRAHFVAITLIPKHNQDPTFWKKAGRLIACPTFGGACVLHEQIGWLLGYCEPNVTCNFRLDISYILVQQGWVIGLLVSPPRPLGGRFLAPYHCTSPILNVLSWLIYQGASVPTTAYAMGWLVGWLVWLVPEPTITGLKISTLQGAVSQNNALFDLGPF